VMPLDADERLADLIEAAARTGSTEGTS
jgi:hypothetical protein